MKNTYPFSPFLKIQFLFPAIFICIFTFIPPLSAESFPSWQPISTGVPETELLSIHPAGLNTRLIFLASRGSLFLTRDGGKNWSRSFKFKGAEGEINKVHFKDALYILTTDGLFASPDKGRSWRRIYSRKKSRENSVRALSVDPKDSEVKYLGTEKGMFCSIDDGDTWFKLRNILEDKPVRHIALHPENSNIIYGATAFRLFKSTDGGETFRKIFSLNRTRELEETDLTDQNADYVNHITSVLVLEKAPSRVFMSTTNAVYASNDSGKSWSALKKTGLTSKTIRDLETDGKGRIYAATKNGIFAYSKEEKRWHEIFQGLSTKKASGLAYSNGRLFASTSNGAFVLDIDMPGNLGPERPERPSQADLLILFNALKKEPTVQEVQKEAVKYGMVDNGKIKRWHVASRLRALVPSFTVEKDKSVENNIDLDRGSSKVADIYISGPDDLEKNYSRNLEWDFADLIWSSEQTSIDNRAKYTVELREEILNEVTRIYFERRRLIMETFLFKDEEPKVYFEKLLRIDELAAGLDAYTGGFFTRKLRENGVVYGVLWGNRKL